jgi:purine operon repressor
MEEVTKRGCEMKRSERLVDFTNYLLTHPRQLTTLSFFSERYGAAKSSISEDLVIVKRIFAETGVGIIETFAGVTGGVLFTPALSDGGSREIAREIANLMKESNRILPGGYIYLSDILGSPQNLHKIGKIIAHEYVETQIDAVMTIATKGIPIAQAVSMILDVPFVIVRRDPKVTEGATLNVNYMSGSSAKVENMTLSKRSLAPGQRVLIVDDFMKGGGTLNGMKSLVREFDCLLAGVAVFAEGPFKGDRLISDYKSILKIEEINVENRSIKVNLGNIYN